MEHLLLRLQSSVFFTVLHALLFTTYQQHGDSEDCNYL